MDYFIFKGISSNNFGLIVKSIDRPILHQRGKASIKIPGRAGVTNVDNNYNNGFMTIECSRTYDSDQELEALKDQLSAWLSGESKLMFDDKPDKYLIAEVFNPISVDQAFGNMKFQVVFEVDPIYYGELQQIYNQITDSEASIDISYSGTSEASEKITLVNQGATPIAGFTIEFEK